MGYVCQLFRIDAAAVNRLLQQPAEIDAFVDELERKYNQPDLQQTVMFSIDKEWKDLFDILNHHLAKQTEDLQDQVRIPDLSKVIPPTMVSKMTDVLSELEFEGLWAGYSEKTQFPQQQLEDAFLELKHAFSSASTVGQGVLICVG